MIKKVLSIIIHPFYLMYLVVSFPFKIINIIIKDKRENSTKKKKDNNQSSTDTSLVFKNLEFIKAGQLLFPNHKTEFEFFFNSFIADKKNFLSENEKLLEDYDNFELEKLRAIEVIYIFGDSKEQLWLTDWKGEENEREIEYFLKNKLLIKKDLTNTSQLRKRVNEEKQRDGNFIIDLLKTIDKDLKPLNKKLIFFNLGWDSYVYTVVDLPSFKKINDKCGTVFQGTEKLRKSK